MAEEKDDLELLVRDGSEKELKDFLALLHPADIADLMEILDEEGRNRVLSVLDPERAGEVLPEIEDPYLEEVLEDIKDEKLTEILHEMDSDDAADILSELPKEHADELIDELDEDDAEDVRELLAYPEDSAGGIMQAELVHVTQGVTVTEAIEVIRQMAKEVSHLHNLFIVDDEGRLIGVVPLRKLILAQPDEGVGKIMDPNVIKAHDYQDQEEVAAIFKKYDLVSMPVVDDSNELLGRITVDDIVDVMEEEADEDIIKMAGAGEEEILTRSSIRSAQARAPWLIASLVGELGVAAIIVSFQESVEHFLELIIFLPLINNMGGTVGNQSATIIVRGLATGRIDVRRIWSVAFKEMRVGFLMGLLYGLIIGLVAFVRDGVEPSVYGHFGLGIIVGGAVCIAMFTAAAFGALVPLFFSKINVDPALATSPFIQTCMDILGTTVYFTIALIYWAA